MLKDADIRKALVQAIKAQRPTYKVVEEMGLTHGTSRADVVALGPTSLWGYELKSDADVLDRLPGQVKEYSQVFDRCWLVTTRRHLEHASPIIPAWWGIALASQQAHGVRIQVHRASESNPSLDPEGLVRLLWRDEILAFLEGRGLAKGLRSSSRERMYKRAVESKLPLHEVRVHVAHVLFHRKKWIAQ